MQVSYFMKQEIELQGLFWICISVNISAEITLDLNLKWPKYGNKYVLSFIVCEIGWAMFGYYGLLIMAGFFKMSLLSTEFILLQIGSIFSLSKYIASLVFRNLMQRMGHHQYIFLFLLIIYFSVVPFCQFYYTLFCLSWLEKFGQICSDYSMDSILSHSKKCLHLFNSLQKGLGYSNP